MGAGGKTSCFYVALRSAVCTRSRLFDREERVIRVDLSRVTFLDACGIGACLKVQRQARASGCDLAFTNPHGIVERVIDLVGLESVLLEGDHRG